VSQQVGEERCEPVTNSNHSPREGREKPRPAAEPLSRRFVMSKLTGYINSDSLDNNGQYMLKVGTSFGTWMLVFFHLLPILVVFGKYLFGKQSTGSDILDIFLYYILNTIIATVIVKWQNQQLTKKTVRFRKKYAVIISFVFIIFVMLRISSSFLFKSS
jgi:hypothetical protein